MEEVAELYADSTLADEDEDGIFYIDDDSDEEENETDILVSV